ncbi:MAG: hypothetical protein K2Q20_11305, partial [Phycisphaerales bacterium]|nr:hypothetical protein [Phycisphaerales bacterium]
GVAPVGWAETSWPTGRETAVDGPCVLIGVDGAASVGPGTPLRPGRTLLIPAGMGRVALTAARSAHVLVARFGVGREST